MGSARSTVHTSIISNSLATQTKRKTCVELLSVIFLHLSSFPKFSGIFPRQLGTSNQGRIPCASAEGSTAAGVDSLSLAEFAELSVKVGVTRIKIETFETFRFSERDFVHKLMKAQ